MSRKRDRADASGRAESPRCSYWLEAIQSGRLAVAIRRRPAAAERFFGRKPLQRKKFDELTQIAVARGMLSMSDKELVRQIQDIDKVVNSVLDSGTAAAESPKHRDGVIAFRVSQPAALWVPMMTPTEVLKLLRGVRKSSIAGGLGPALEAKLLRRDRKSVV